MKLIKRQKYKTEVVEKSARALRKILSKREAEWERKKYAKSFHRKHQTPNAPLINFSNGILSFQLPRKNVPTINKNFGAWKNLFQSCRELWATAREDVTLNSLNSPMILNLLPLPWEGQPSSSLTSAQGGREEGRKRRASRQQRLGG